MPADLVPEITNSLAPAPKTTGVKSQGLEELVFDLVHPVGGNVAPSKFSDSNVWASKEAPMLHKLKNSRSFFIIFLFL
ncbi:hypothetical protein IX38_00740 [Chryseobacterium luteum]|uniref:Uncharacterized protein n=1 Tax=Chryseobacterium luteum TaxID=421531 RepID=A0A085ZXB3_9FLAO|nr:hypothetical protein IX38_00740 [Chryseobacterium luteum]